MKFTVTITSAAFLPPTATKFNVEIYFKMYPTCSVLKTVNFICMPVSTLNSTCNGRMLIGSIEETGSFL